MKSIFFSITLVFFIFSCNSDDNSNVDNVLLPPADPIIGSWIITNSYSVSANGDVFQYDMNNCSLLTNRQFTSDGLYYIESHGLNNTGNCDIFTSDGTWNNQTPGEYLYSYDNQGPLNLSVIFTNNDNNMETIIITDETEYHQTFQRQ